MRKLLIAAVGVMQLTSSFAADPAAGTVVTRAKNAFAAQLAMQDPRGAWIAEDAIYQYTLSEYGLRGSGVNLNVEGRQAVLAHLRALADSAPRASVANVYVFPTLEPDLVFVQYELKPADGSKTSMPLAIVQMRGNEIVKYTQLSRTPEILQALKANMTPVN